MGRVVYQCGASCLLKWGELSSESGASCLGASFMWGELSWGELSLGRVVCNSYRVDPKSLKVLGFTQLALHLEVHSGLNFRVVFLQNYLNFLMK